MSYAFQSSADLPAGRNVTSRELFHLHLRNAEQAASWAKQRAAGNAWYLQNEPTPHRSWMVESGYPDVHTPVPPRGGLTDDASKLIRLARESGGWEDGIERLMDAARIASDEKITERSERSTSVELHRLTVEMLKGGALMLWLVEGSWAYMGEDGDAGEDHYLFTSEAEARGRYNTLYTERVNG